MHAPMQLKVNVLRLYKLLISTFIILVIGAHALPVLQRLQGKKTDIVPVMVYACIALSRSQPNPDRTNPLIGMTSTGNEFDIDPESVG